MKYLSMLVLCLLMALQTHSQTTLTPRVQTLVNAKGDTLIQMSLADAKIVLADVLQKQVADSIIAEYEKSDSLQTVTINLKNAELKALQEKFTNSEAMVKNLNTILSNKDTEVETLNGIIKQQKREIFKQKVQKIIGYSAAVVLPILVLIFAK